MWASRIKKEIQIIEVFDNTKLFLCLSNLRATFCLTVVTNKRIILYFFLTPLEISKKYYYYLVEKFAPNIGMSYYL